MTNTDINKKQLNQMIAVSFISGFLCVYFTFGLRVGMGLTLFVLISTALMIVFLNSQKTIINRKALVWFVPIVVLSLSYTLRAQRIFSIYNIILMWLMLSCLLLDLRNELKISSTGLEFVYRSIARFFEPFYELKNSISLISSNVLGKSKKAEAIKQIVIGIIICLPLSLVVYVLLATADHVFLDLATKFLSHINFSMVIEHSIKIVLSIAVSIYFFSSLYRLLFCKKPKEIETIKQVEAFESAIEKQTATNEAATAQTDKSKPTQPIKQKQQPQGLITFIMINGVLMLMYLVFSYVQIRYLFLKSTLPYGFEYAIYARRGFFELLFLTFLNISIILITIRIAEHRIYEAKVSGSSVVKFVMYILCILTFVLLTSSFYRMFLYYQAYGLTRLRLFVMIFLFFEAVGLIATLIYIKNPKTKLFACCTIICLAFYILINIVNIDGMIAKNHVEIYNKKGEADFEYLSTLSADAFNTFDQASLAFKVGFNEDLDYKRFLTNNYLPPYNQDTFEWQSNNIPYNKAVKQLSTDE